MTDLGLLGPIVATKRTELGSRLGDTPIDALRSAAVPTNRSLKAALDRPQNVGLHYNTDLAIA